MTRVAMISFRKILAGLALGALIAFPACNEDDNSGGGNKHVNTWIYDNMELYYLWNTELPNSPNKSKDPDEFFNSLLSDQDRFSWIQEDYIELLNSLQGVNKEAGYEFKLYLESEGSENVIAQIMYIKAGSLVETEGKDLMRGDVITHINTERMTTANYQELLGEISEGHTIQYSRGGIDKGTLTLNTAEFAENPNFMSKIIDTGDGHKIGYYVYNFFATGPTSTSNQYNSEMDAIFNEFKSEAITDLVVDLRYNSGGAEGATINLASLIGDNIDNTITFTRRQYNNDLQAALINDPNYGYDFLIKKFTTKAANVGPLLNNGRVYILTSSRTASASELLINGLKPHMDVFLIGDVTVGKNVGSISIYEDNDPKNTWGMQPIVVKSYNSANQSNYSEGFLPNVSDLDNDLDLKAIGDEEEILLSLAIDHITGSSAGRNKLNARRGGLESLGTSADFKRGSYNLVIDDERLKSFVKSTVVE
jgi:C-terminal processing protease CtpA/Prc